MFDDSSNAPNPYEMHRHLGLKDHVSLERLERLSEEALSSLAAGLGAFRYDVGWPVDLSAHDIRLGRRYGFKPKPCVEAVNENGLIEEDYNFVGFGAKLDKSAVDATLSSAFPFLASRRHSYDSFRTWFAHVHSDEMETCRAQINFVVENAAGHRILSIDRRGKHHVIVPVAGDVVFLDTACKHAVLPDQSGGIDFMKANPMTAVFMTLDNVYN